MFQPHKREDPPAADARVHPSRRSTDREQNRSILYIDDDWAHLLSQRGLLESAGYVVEATDSSAVGLRSYIQNNFDAVILDFHLPFAAGGGLATVMRRFRRDIPLIRIADSNHSVGEVPGPWDWELPQGLPSALFLASVCRAVERAQAHP